MPAVVARVSAKAERGYGGRASARKQSAGATGPRTLPGCPVVCGLWPLYYGAPDPQAARVQSVGGVARRICVFLTQLCQKYTIQ